jgi:hypothetical protein
MAKPRKNKHAIKGGFSGIPRIVMDHRDYINLSGNAVKLLNELARQYRGSNNGDLTTAYSLLRQRGFKSKGTIERNRKELIEARLIIKTREGRFTNPHGVCALYALSWQSIDECNNKLELAATITPPRKFSLEHITNPIPTIGHGSTSKQGRQREKDHQGRYTSTSKQGRLTVVT